MAAAHDSSRRVYAGALRATRRMAQGMALGALVYPAARGSAILPGRFPRRDLGEAEQRAAAWRTAFWFESPLSCLAFLTFAAIVSGIFLVCLPAPDTIGMLLAFGLTLLPARFTIGWGRFQAPPGSLAKQATPRDFSAAEIRTGAARDDVRIRW